MKENIEKWLVLAFVVALGLLASVAVVAVRNIGRSITSSDWVNHTHAVILESDAILSALRAGDAALRDYVLGGDARDQAAYREAYAEMAEHLEVAKALTRAEPASNQKILLLEPLVIQRVDFARVVVRAYQEGGLEAARKALGAGAGGETARQVQLLVEKLKAEARVSLLARDKALYLQAQTTRWTVLTGVALNFLLLGFMAWLIRDDLAARRRAAAVLREANQQLEVKVRERTSELAQANQTLLEENLERQWTNQALEHQLRYSQLIINSIRDPIFVISKALNITRLNPVATPLTGLEPSELIGSSLRRVVRLIPSQSPGPTSGPDPVAHALRHGHELQDCAAELLRKDGRAMPARFSLFPVRDQDKVVGGVAILRLTEAHGEDRR